VVIPRPPGQWTIGSQSAGYVTTAVMDGFGRWVCPVPIDPHAATPQLQANTGLSGVLETVYAAPETSGATVVTLVATAPTPAGSITIGPTTFEIPVIAAEGLTFPTIPGLYITPQSQNHDHHNGYASTVMVAGLERMMNKYNQLISALRVTMLYVLDIPLPLPQSPEIDALSLPKGGLFDYDHGNWCPPHVSHRFGDEADIIPPYDAPWAQRSLARAAQEAGFFFPVKAESPAAPVGPHYHWHMCITGPGTPHQCIELTQDQETQP